MPPYYYQPGQEHPRKKTRVTKAFKDEDEMDYDRIVLVSGLKKRNRAKDQVDQRKPTKLLPLIILILATGMVAGDAKHCLFHWSLESSIWTV
jgi:hypothetical protein